MKNKFLFLVLILSLFLVESCKKELVPTVITSEVTYALATSAISGGTITDEGSGTVVSRGVCWSHDIAPSIADNKTSDGAGAGTFTSNLTLLFPLNKTTSKSFLFFDIISKVVLPILPVDPKIQIFFFIRLVNFQK